MNKKKLIIASIVIVTIIGFVMLKNKSSTNNIYYDVENIPQTLDPQVVDDKTGQMVIKHTFEGLTTTDEKGELVLGVAENHTASEDNLTHTFKIKENAKWNNEELTPVKAQDFVFAFQRTVDPRTKSKNQNELWFIKNAKQISQNKMGVEQLGVKAIDDKTLEIKLEFFPNDFLEILSKSYSAPCNQEFFNETNGAYGISVKNILSNGEYNATSFDPESHISMARSEEKNTDSNVDFIKLLLRTDELERTSRFNDNTTSALIVDEEAKNKEANVEATVVKTDVYSLIINEGKEVLNNAEFKNALNYSINRDELAKTFKESTRPPENIFSKEMVVQSVLYNEKTGKTVQNEYNSGLAKENYQKVFSAVGKIPTFTMIMEKNDEQKEIVDNIIQMWQKEIGVFVNVEQLEKTEFDLRIKNMNYDMALIRESSDGNGAVMAIESMFIKLKGGVPEHIISQINQFKSISDTNQKIAILQQIERELLNSKIIIPIFTKSKVLETTKDMVNVVYLNSLGIIDFRFVSM